MRKNTKEIFIMSFQWGLWIVLLLSAFIKSKRIFSINLNFVGDFFVFLGIILIFLASAAHGSTNKFKLKASYLPNPKAKLVTKGIYTYIRHPIYGAFIFISFGSALIISSIMSIFISIITLFFYNFKALYEEKFLDREYPSYSLYKEQSSKFIPNIIKIFK